jgi:hypothetical protein
LCSSTGCAAGVSSDCRPVLPANVTVRSNQDVASPEGDRDGGTEQWSQERSRGKPRLTATTVRNGMRLLFAAPMESSPTRGAHAIPRNWRGFRPWTGLPASPQPARGPPPPLPSRPWTIGVLVGVAFHSPRRVGLRSEQDGIRGTMQRDRPVGPSEGMKSDKVGGMDLPWGA